MSTNNSALNVNEKPYSDEIERQKKILQRNPFIQQMLEAFPECAAIVNAERRIIVANNALQNILHRDNGHAIEGLRLGDHLQCTNALSSDDGCGSTEACATCGALIATLSALQGKSATEECCLTVSVDDITSALDFRVYTSPMTVEGEQFSVVSLVDISSEKRRTVLEHIFFHDVNNTAGAIYGLASLLPIIDDEEERVDILHRVATASRQLLDEIESQRDLLAAENNELRVTMQEVPAADLMQSLQSLYEHHPAGENRSIVIGEVAAAMAMTDRTHLSRSLGNLVRNALEAIKPGDSVTLSCTESEDDMLTFRIHNPGRIPRDVELQIFHRSFSTKGAGRGLGTYSVRLLVERYLNGSAGFTTSDEHGTEFFVTVPRARHIS